MEGVLKDTFATVLICIVFVAIMYFVLFTVKSARYKDFIETEGITIDIEAVVIMEDNGETKVAKNKYNIAYTYTIDGVEYNGAMISDTSISAGTKIKVMYNPKRVEESKGSLK